MILHPLADWIRPERIVRMYTGRYCDLDMPSDHRAVFNEQDECWYVWQRRWRWSRR